MAAFLLISFLLFVSPSFFKSIAEDFILITVEFFFFFLCVLSSSNFISIIAFSFEAKKSFAPLPSNILSILNLFFCFIKSNTVSIFFGISTPEISFLLIFADVVVKDVFFCSPFIRLFILKNELLFL